MPYFVKFHSSKNNHLYGNTYISNTCIDKK